MRLSVFASGGGSNLGAILDAIDAGTLAASVAVVVTDREGIGALERAAARGIPREVVTPEAQDYASGARFADALLDVLARYDTHAIALAGYLKRIPPEVVAAFRHRILNVHPSLLPAFGGAGMYGKHVHRAVLDYGARFSGATVHFVDTEFDTGPVVLQDTVPVHADDTPEALAARVLAVEHQVFPRALALLADGRLSLDGRLVRILPVASSQ
ncbi:phosphoribosylglycinamide formyltransferase [Rubricoccus marinus]|uniref:Phosphoribosylglycinamide formyltransferase n=2 Tax=Rubricoccus marinus TaxID=716817 RepID=A0A259TZY1_9BACT|nr:phosphoribosylglycinamide formyltransferase [Rubricoccus marinus]